MGEQVSDSEIRFLREIDRGGWGQVWLADDIALGRQVAVKLFDHQSPVIVSVQRQARALARVSHPNVVTVHGVRTLHHPEDGESRDCIIMEFVDGDTLDARLAGPPLSLDEAVTIGRGLASGLLAVHNAETAHGDFHGGNVVIASDGCPKIIDIFERFTLRYAPTATREQSTLIDRRNLVSMLRDVMNHTTGVPREQRLAFEEHDQSSVLSIVDSFERAVLGTLESSTRPRNPVAPAATLIDRVKEYLAETRHRIRLSDLIAEETDRYIETVAGEEFSRNIRPDTDSVKTRVLRYDDAAEGLVGIALLLARWGDEEAVSLLLRTTSCIAATFEETGFTAWSSLQWYPLMKVVYGVGLGCEARREHLPLRTLLFHRLRSQQREALVIDAVTENILELVRMNAFNAVHGREHKYGVSAHAAEAMSPIGTQLLSVGADFDRMFDRFEAIYSLSVARHRSETGRQVWGPVGRFAYPGFHLSSSRAVDDIAALAQSDPAWMHQSAGLLGDTPEAVRGLVDEYTKEVLAHVRRW